MPAPLMPKNDDALMYKTVWTPKQGVAKTVEVDFSSLSSEPLLLANLARLRPIFQAVSPATAKNYMKGLRNIVSFLRWYRKQFGAAPALIEDVDSRFTHYFVLWESEKPCKDPPKAINTRIFRRTLSALGVMEALLPVNPFTEGRDEQAERETLSDEELRALLNRAKLEARAVINRTREAHSLASKGSDPRSSVGGQLGNWSKPENRAYVLKRVLGRRLETFDDLRFRLGHSSAVSACARYPGALCVQADGTFQRKTGWNFHLRWFFPWAEDLLPFGILVMLRLGWNLTTLAALRSRRWWAPHQFRFGRQGAEEYAFIVSYKARGRTDRLSEATEVRAPSSMRPWSHPFRLLRFVDYCTAALRREVCRRAAELKQREVSLSDDEVKELERLRFIKDDLFIFKSEKGIFSLAWDLQHTGGGFSRQLDAFAARAGVEFDFRDLRDAPILSGYKASGHNIIVAQIIAGHADPSTTTLYLRRKRTLDAVWKAASAVFDQSLRLIEAGSFDVEQLRQLLADQGFSTPQVSRLLDPATTTRWGNRCADPAKPPPGFDRGLRPGGNCRLQDCIDGCPYARWFSDSLEHVARQLVLAERMHNQVGLETTAAGSHIDRIDRCKDLLSRWPRDAVTEALRAARELSGTVTEPDLFLGTALP